MVTAVTTIDEVSRVRTTPVTDAIRTTQVWRDKRRSERSIQQLELLHLSYIIQWRYDKAREIAAQIEALYADRAANDIRRIPRRAFR
jgi:hypothetical protein